MVMVTILKRGNEWVSIQNLDDEDCLWLYGEGVVGNAHIVSPVNVKESQIQAHISKGWIRQ